MDAIRDACWREEALTIRYADQGHVVSERTILPLAVMYTDRTLTVLAWCCLREGFRMFRTDRIIELNNAGKSFRPRRVTLLRDYLAELPGVGETTPTEFKPSKRARSQSRQHR